MADFKILGGTDPVNQSLGVMTQGLGFPLRDVEPSTAGGPVNVVVERVLDANDFTDQEPSALGVPLQVTFGAAQSNAFFDLDALGNITVLSEDEFVWRARFVVGREGAGGESQIYIRSLVNGVQVGNSSHLIVDSPRVEIPVELEGVATLALNDVIAFQIVRDTDATNSGGLRAGNPSVAGWNPSPSARLTVDRYIAVQT